MVNLKRLLLAGTFLMLSGEALAQSNPGLTYGQVPTAAQWNSYFAIKQDLLNYTPLPIAGGVMTGALVTTASQTFAAGFNITPGVAPTTPNNGDMWTTAVGLYVEINGVTVGPLGASNITSVSNSDGTLTISPTTGVVVASLALGHANTWSAVQTFTNSDIALLGSSTGFTTFTSANSGASNFTLTFPAVTSTLAVLGQAQTWTAVQTFTNSDIALLGSSTGKTTFTSANAGASNFTLTVPAVTDTIAVVGSTVASFNTRTGSVSPAVGDYTTSQLYNCTITPQGRLTFLTGTPVQTSSTTGATSHYYTPYLGQFVPIYDGTRFICTDTGGELTQTAADTTKSPAAVAANSCYDVFVWSDSGTIRATRGVVWTNTTTRAAALTRKNGILVNNVAVTNGPGQFLGTYVGTECSNASSTFDWIIGASASGGTAASLNAWNQYNRVDVSTIVTDSGVAYSYATSTIRQARASAGNQITFVSGNTEDSIQTTLNSSNQTSATTGDGYQIGIGFDSTSTFYGQPIDFRPGTAANQIGALSGAWVIVPQLGRHVISSNENVNAAVANNFDQLSLDALGFTFRM